VFHRQVGVPRNDVEAQERNPLLLGSVDVGSVPDPGEEDAPIVGAELEDHPVVATSGVP